MVQYYCMEKPFSDPQAPQCGQAAIAQCVECIAYNGADVPLCADHAMAATHVGHQVRVMPVAPPADLVREFLNGLRQWLTDLDPAELTSLIDQADSKLIEILQIVGERMERRATLAAAAVVDELVEKRGWSRDEAIALTGARPGGGAGDFASMLQTVVDRIRP